MITPQSKYAHALQMILDTIPVITDDGQMYYESYDYNGNFINAQPVTPSQVINEIQRLAYEALHGK